MTGRSASSPSIFIVDVVIIIISIVTSMDINVQDVARPRRRKRSGTKRPATWTQEVVNDERQTDYSPPTQSLTLPNTTTTDNPLATNNDGGRSHEEIEWVMLCFK